MVGRFPRGKRGLKFFFKDETTRFHFRRFPRGKRGLKSTGHWVQRLDYQCRFPRGKRGLKFSTLLRPLLLRLVASLAGSVD